MAAAEVSVREIFTGLSNSDQDAKLSALRSLGVLASTSRGLARLIADSTSLPRMCFYVAGLCESSISPTREVASLALSVLWHLLDADGKVAVSCLAEPTSVSWFVRRRSQRPCRLG